MHRAGLRPLLAALAALPLALPAMAQTPPSALHGPAPDCIAPALAQAGARLTSEEGPPPFQLAVHFCAATDAVPPRRPVRRT